MRRTLFVFVLIFSAVVLMLLCGLILAGLFFATSASSNYDLTNTPEVIGYVNPYDTSVSIDKTIGTTPAPQTPPPEVIPQEYFSQEEDRTDEYRQRRGHREDDDEREVDTEEDDDDEEIETFDEWEEERSIFSDDFSMYSTPSCLSGEDTFGPWEVVFSGFGCVDIQNPDDTTWLSLVPQESIEENETHAALVVGPEFSNTLTYEIRLKTIEQLRDTSPNPWEVGWVLWHYTDNEHFYYAILKPNGWELGKRDPAYPGGQRFLATGSTPVYPVGDANDVKIIHDDTNTIIFSANGEVLTVFTDEETPYSAGRIGMYTEDALVYFTDVEVN